MQIDEPNLKEIQKLCKSNRVKSLFAFGSVVREDYNDESDIDLVVDFDESDPMKYTDLYFHLKDELENLLKRHIDLLEDRAIKNKVFRRQLDNTKVKLYG